MPPVNPRTNQEKADYFRDTIYSSFDEIVQHNKLHRFKKQGGAYFVDLESTAMIVHDTIIACYTAIQRNGGSFETPLQCKNYLYYSADKLGNKVDAKSRRTGELTVLRSASESYSPNTHYSVVQSVDGDAIDDLDEKRSHADHNEQEAESDEHDAAEQRKLLAGHVIVAAHGLPTELRRIVLLQLVDELTYRQIAERLNLSMSAVKNKMWRGKNQIKAALGRG